MVTLNERRLLYIWSDTDLSSILSLLYKQTRERETYVLIPEPLNPTSVHRIRAEFKASGEKLVRPWWASIKFRCTTETIEQQIDGSER